MREPERRITRNINSTSTAVARLRWTVGFMNQRGGLQCLPWPFARQLSRRKPSELVVDNREQSRPGGRIPVLEGLHDLRKFIHYCLP